MDPKRQGQWPGNGRIWAKASLPDVLAAVRRAAGQAGWHTVTYADGGFYFFGHTQDWGSAELCGPPPNQCRSLSCSGSSGRSARSTRPAHAPASPRATRGPLVGPVRHGVDLDSDEAQREHERAARGWGGTKSYLVICCGSAVAGDDQTGLWHVSAASAVSRAQTRRPDVTGCLGPWYRCNTADQQIHSILAGQSYFARPAGFEPATRCLEGRFTQRVNQPMARSEAARGARG